MITNYPKIPDSSNKIMRSIKARFNKMKKNEPNASDYICFRRAVHEQGFTEDAIRKNFNELVDKGDYQRSVKELLIEQLIGANEKTVKSEDVSSKSVAKIL